jgi:hypothetical protein
MERRNVSSTGVTEAGKKTKQDEQVKNNRKKN